MATDQASIERALIEGALAAFGTNLSSVTLYGSYVRGTYSAGRSDINVLLLIHEADAGQLRAFGTGSKRLLRGQRFTPLVLTTAEFANSADVFPLEYADIVGRHRTIHGPDPTVDLRLEQRNLRHQLEHLLRGNLVSLRQIILACGTSERDLRAQLLHWFGPMAVVFRGLVRLTGSTGNDSASGLQALEEAIREANRHFGFEPGPFLTLARIHADPKAAKSHPMAPLALELEARLTAFVDAVDRFEDRKGEDGETRGS